MLLEHVNARLSASYTTENEVFVTAFYGIYDPAERLFTYSCAGHNPPQLKRCSLGRVDSLEDVGGPPLGVFPGVDYALSRLTLNPGDILVLYTDGVTEAMNADNKQFGLEQLNGVLRRCNLGAQEMRDAILGAVDRFTESKSALDDRTLLVAKVL